jgi:prepilin-type N-terminal cleavage/methylation domain-containing protein
MKADNGRARGERGFTLVETSVALLVMLVAGLAASSLFVYSIKYNAGATNRAVAQSLAQKQMETIRKTPFDTIAASNATVATAGHSYTVDVAVCNDGTAACGGSAAVKRVTVTVTPQGAGSSWALSSVTLVTFRSSTGTGAYL